MKYIIKLLVLLLLVFACTENPTEPKKEENKYWSVPTDEAIMLYYREFFCSVRLDSTVAGEIQYSLDVAKSVVSDTTITVHKNWVFGVLRVKTNEDLYNAFDTTNTFRFNYQPLDSLLTFFELKNGDKLYNTITLIFPEYYNMVVLGQIFSRIDGVEWAEQSVRATPPICNEDIKLEICNDIYNFTFYGRCPKHTWIVEVVNDNATIIKEW